MKSANMAPVYAASMYPELAEICRKHGYALSIHGSLARDFDLVAIPWTILAAEPKVILDNIAEEFNVVKIGELVIKEHGRMTYTIIMGFGECFLDFSFMPLIK